MRIDVTSAFQGLSTTLPDLYNQIGGLGWSVKKVSFDKAAGEYVAVAQSPYGEKVEKTGTTDLYAVSNLLFAITRKQYMRTSAQEKVGMWRNTWTDQLQPIAEAYAKAPIYDPKAAAAYKELADDSVRRAAELAKQLHIEVTDNPEPYPHAQAMADDIHKRQHFEVSRANSEHPLWTPEQNVAFRTVHDVLGHGVSGGDFGWEGENQACAAHFPLLSPQAQAALFSECIAQTAYAAHYRGFGPQKVALFPEFYEPAQKAEGVGPGYKGVHPSQSQAPVAMPSVKPSTPVGLPEGTIAPHQEALGLTPVMSPTAGVNPALADPNVGFDAGVLTPEPNAYIHHGDPLEGQAVMDNARLIDTEWAQLKTGENEPDYERMKQAVVNAFRAVLLSPVKDLRWNTIHYQDIAGVPASTTDPVAYWDTLEKKRQEWNVKNFGEVARFSHRPYAKRVPELEHIIYQMNPHAGWEAAKERAKKLMFDWETEEQNKVLEAEKDRPEEKRMNGYEVENLVNKNLTKRIEMYVKEFQPALDFEAAAKPQDDSLFQLEPQPKMQKLDRYGAFMGTHLKAISQISQHVDELLKAALEDVHEHDGSGHHFRALCLQLGVPGVGPKVCSFAWLLLQPMTSQLATIDTHMMDVLGHNYSREMNNRDYFKFERELQAGRDAAGYSHIPLGAFQWGMWDTKRTGEGSHQDHSGLRVLDPLPYDAIDWAAKDTNLKGDSWARQAPDWWKNTQPYRDEVGQHWDEEIAPGWAKNKIPFNQIQPAPILATHTHSLSTFAKTSASLLTPWFEHPDTGEQVVGLPGETLMQHATKTLGKGTPDIWAMLANAGKR